MNGSTHARISGALFDFMGYLTTRDPPVVAGSCCSPNEVLDAFEDWAASRGLSYSDAEVRSWNLGEALIDLMVEGRMTVSEFLLKNARDDYISLDDLYPLAKVEILLPQEGEVDFVRLLSKWLAKYPGGSFPGGTYFTELPFAGAKLVATTSRGSKVALIRVTRR